MRPMGESAPLIMVISEGQRLLFRFSGRGYEVFHMVPSMSEVLKRLLRKILVPALNLLNFKSL